MNEWKTYKQTLYKQIYISLLQNIIFTNLPWAQRTSVADWLLKPLILVLNCMTHEYQKFKLIDIQGDQLYLSVYFWYLGKKWLFHCPRVPQRTLDKSIFTRYQNNMAMFIWSGFFCTFLEQRRGGAKYLLGGGVRFRSSPLWKMPRYAPGSSVYKWYGEQCTLTYHFHLYIYSLENIVRKKGFNPTPSQNDTFLYTFFFLPIISNKVEFYFRDVAALTAKNKKIRRKRGRKIKEKKRGGRVTT